MTAPRPDHVYPCLTGPDRLVVSVTPQEVLYCERGDQGHFPLNRPMTTQRVEEFLLECPRTSLGRVSVSHLIFPGDR